MRSYNCYGCRDALTIRSGKPESFVFLRCKLCGERTAMCFPEDMEKHMVHNEAPEWCPKLRGESGEQVQ